MDIDYAEPSSQQSPFHQTGELLTDATSCPMCRRMIINAGLDEVVIRRTEEEFDIVPVQKWIDEDDSL